MKNELTLLILAGGMGSRFGGLKQVEPIGPNGEFLIDYSIYDAMLSGFTRVVFVIKKEHEKIFKETVGNRIAGKIKVEYVFQELSDVPEGFDYPKDRVKPWGTAHAILCSKSFVQGPFLMINADDFYGREAYQKAAQFLKEKKNEDTYCIIGYPVSTTLSMNGAVKRGICFTDNGKLTELKESLVTKKDNIVATPLDGSTPFEVKENTYASMNMLGFQPSIFAYLEKDFPRFLKENKENLSTCEYLIPDSLMKLNKEKYAEVVLIPTTSTWLGITYKEDKEKVVTQLNEWIKEGRYPAILWENKK